MRLGKRMAVWLVIWTGVLLAAGGRLLLAQAAAGGGVTVRGTVTDPDAAVIPGATLTLTPPTGRAYTAISATDGSYAIVGVPAGSYAFTATMNGFATYVRQGVRVGAQPLTIDVKLAIQDQTQQVTVNAQSTQLSVDQDNNASSTVIKDKDLDALSDDPDDLSSQLSALAGPAAGPNGGQIYVDGFTGGQLPPKSSIREIRINQNPFSAQYDKAGYGRVEVFTKPGTDKYHGNYSIQGGLNSFNTSNPFLGSLNQQPGYYTLFQLGSVTGPVTKNSSFTVGGSNRTIQDNNIINPTGFYTNSPTSTTLCAPGDLTCTDVGGYPESARALGHIRHRSDIAPRYDIALGEKNTFSVRYQYETQDEQNGGLGGASTLPSAGYSDTASENTIRVTDTQILSAKVINETRFEYQRDVSTQTPNSVAPAVSVQGSFVGGGTSLGQLSTTEDHIEVQNYTSVQLAKHFLRLGGRLRTTGESLTSNAGANGTLTYTSLLDPCVFPGTRGRPSNCAPGVTAVCDPANVGANISSYQCGVASQYTVTRITQPTIASRTTDLGLYAEDDWKVRPNLTLTGGIRYETQNVIHSDRDFAPRVSFAWGLPHKGGAPLTVLRGGYGIFYDRFDQQNILTAIRLNGFNQVQATVANPGPACQPTVQGACGASNVGNSTIYSLGPGLRSSYNLQAAIGLDQQVGKSTTISANYINGHGVHQYLTRSLQDTAAAPFNYQFQSGAVFRENQIFVNINSRFKHVTIFGFYALTYANANTGGATTFATDPVHPAVDYGRATFGVRNRAVFGGSWQAPYHFTFSPFLLAFSGTPYDLTSGLDTNGDSIFNDRPYFANGSSGNCFRGSDFSTVQTGGLTQVPVNYCTAPTNFTLNLRTSRTFGLGPKIERGGGDGAGAGPGGPGPGRGPGGGGRGPGGGGGGGGGGPFGTGGNNTPHRYNVTLGAAAFNIFNVIPYGQPVAVLTSPRFGEFTSLAGGPFSSATAVRRFVLQASFNF